MANFKINFACPYRWNAHNGSRTSALLRLFQEEEEFSRTKVQPAPPPHQFLFSRSARDID